MPYTVQVQPVPSRPIAVVRHRVAPTELPRIIPQSCGLVWKTVKAAQIKDAGRHIAIYRHAGPGLLDVEVGVEVGSPFPDHDPVVGSLTPAGEAATVTHFGPYPKLADANRAIRDWCAANNRTLAGPSWEIYGHWLEEWNTNPSQIRTDVFYLLKN